ncbi:sulfatase [Puniceicoccales bacterium CK1056]|uniref:Sulfatase n=1 Tax=Oceanipulchritudo coccoides TaxID=2706888 RepID=A0A6B2M4B9_9BACT|nr:sulfatase [Oceanipulchritudo coccoides]NDV63196.1 sulfatase [Oceanipulchritudo coccoides]
MKKSILFALFALFVVTLGAQDQRPNVLMIVVDDLKPATGAYGDSFAITPEMDRLASRGSVFLNNHCQQAVCGASRASALTGLRPDTVQVWDFKSRMRDQLPDLVTLPQHFLQNGYHTASLGKIFDPRCCDGRDTNDAASWSQPHWTADTPNLTKNHFGNPANEGKTTECLPENVDDNFYGDGLRTERAIEILKEQKDSEKPFFLAVGFKKPHLPFVAPKKYWNLYDRESVPLAPFQQMPEDAPAFHFQDSWELRSGYKNIPEGILPEDMQRRMVHGYYACVSYIDAQVGRLLQELKTQGLEDNTIIVLWGDHGWHLGDHGMWCKHTNYEQATRSPLIIVDPRMEKSSGRIKRPTEFVDIAPTLAELCGIPALPEFQGQSLVSLMSCDSADSKPFAVSQFARSKGAANNLMGYAFRDERYRVILWIDMAFKKGERSGELVSTEMYDYETDPGETRNVAGVAEYTPILDNLMDKIREFALEHLGVSWRTQD